MSGHTPGPWSIVESIDPGMVSSWSIQIGAHQLPFFPYKRVYSECRSQSGLVSDYEMHANARLIAAAPELLAHLKFAHAALRGLPGIGSSAQVQEMGAVIERATQ